MIRNRAERRQFAGIYWTNIKIVRMVLLISSFVLFALGLSDFLIAFLKTPADIEIGSSYILINGVNFAILVLEFLFGSLIAIVSLILEFWEKEHESFD